MKANQLPTTDSTCFNNRKDIMVANCSKRMARNRIHKTASERVSKVNKDTVRKDHPVLILSIYVLLITLFLLLCGIPAIADDVFPPYVSQTSPISGTVHQSLDDIVITMSDGSGVGVDESVVSASITVEPLGNSLYSAYLSNLSTFYQSLLVPDEYSYTSLSSNRIAMSGDYAVHGGDNYILILKPRCGNWDIVHFEEFGEADADDYFGYSVDINGDFVAVGGPGDDNAKGVDAGAVHIVKNNGGTWAQESLLMASDGGPGDSFGYSVAMSGNYAIVGAYQSDIGGEIDAGAAYVFHYNDDDQDGAWTWSQVQKLTANDNNGDAAGNDGFGYTVAMDGNYAVIGAYADDIRDGVMDDGSAYIYELSNGTWQFTSKVTANDLEVYNGIHFGSSVSISGDTIAIGAPCPSDSQHPGGAYVFERQAGAWIAVAKWAPEQPVNSSHFGHSLSLSGNYAVVSAPQDETGAVHVFKLENGVWDEVDKVLLPWESNGDVSIDNFGYSIAINDGHFISGSSYHGETQRGNIFTSYYIPFVTDMDGDEFSTESGDMDDSNPTVYPGSTYPGVITFTQSLGNSIFTFTPADGFREGEYKVTYTPVDIAGNSAGQQTILFMVDNTGPEVTSADPVNNSIAYDPPTSYTLHFYEVGSGVDLGQSSLSVTYDDQGTMQTVQGTWAAYSQHIVFTPTQTLTENLYTVNATLADAAGNQGTPASFTFEVDQTPPERPCVSSSRYTCSLGEIPEIFYTHDQSLIGYLHYEVGATWSISGVSDYTHNRISAGVDYFSLACQIGMNPPISITVKDQAGNVSDATEISVYVFEDLPPVVTPYVDGSGTGGSAYISWEHYGEAEHFSHYDIYVFPADVNITYYNYNQYKVGSTTDKYFTATGLTQGSVYFFAVAPYDKAGVAPNITDIPLIQEIIGDGMGPECPDNLNVDSHANSLTFYWDSPEDPTDDIAEYMVTFDGGTPVSVLTNTVHTEGGLDFETEYSFKVVTIDSLGYECCGGPLGLDSSRGGIS